MSDETEGLSLFGSKELLTPSQARELRDMMKGEGWKLLRRVLFGATRAYGEQALNPTIAEEDRKRLAYEAQAWGKLMNIMPQLVDQYIVKLNQTAKAD